MNNELYEKGLKVKETMSNCDSADRIAFIGLGMMGYPLAGRLAAAGYPLAVFDLNPRALTNLVLTSPAASVLQRQLPHKMQMLS